jgi:hypothetical protein
MACGGCADARDLVNAPHANIRLPSAASFVFMRIPLCPALIAHLWKSMQPVEDTSTPSRADAQRLWPTVRLLLHQNIAPLFVAGNLANNSGTTSSARCSRNFELVPNCLGRQDSPGLVHASRPKGAAPARPTMLAVVIWMCAPPASSLLSAIRVRIQVPVHINIARLGRVAEQRYVAIRVANDVLWWRVACDTL